MNRYVEFKDNQQEKFNALPIKFAYTNKRLEEIKQSWNCNSNDLVRIMGNGFMLKKNEWMLTQWNNMYEAEWNELKTNMDFMRDAFIYELGNHEYCITYDDMETLETLDITEEEINNNKELRQCYLSARKEYINHVDEY